jgi:hypothetical protein
VEEFSGSMVMSASSGFLQLALQDKLFHGTPGQVDSSSLPALRDRSEFAPTARRGRQDDSCFLCRFGQSTFFRKQ